MGSYAGASSILADLERLRRIAGHVNADDPVYRAAFTPGTVLGLVEALDLLIHLHGDIGAQVVDEVLGVCRAGDRLTALDARRGL